MKTKAKLTLAISTLSAVVLAAGVTSTFAWFTTQAKANLTTGTMTVSTVSNITINVQKLAYDTGTAQTNFNTQTQNASDSGVALGPVSSVDGLNFYAPEALRTGGVGDVYVDTDMKAVTTKTAWANSNDYVGYVKYGIHVEADADTGAPRTLKYKITPTVTDTELIAAYRVALYEATYSGGYVPGSKVGIYASATGSSAGWDTTGDSGSALTTTTYATTAISGVASPVAVPGSVTTASAISKYYIFSAWVEGCDSNAVNDKISGETLQVDIEFSLE